MEYEMKKIRSWSWLPTYLTFLAIVLIYGTLFGIAPIIYLFSDSSSLILWAAFPLLSILLICSLIPLTISAWRKLGKKHGLGVIISATLILMVSFFTYGIWALLLAGIKSGFQFLL